jgi:flagellar motor switch/type III secretory pathway protein FliN
MASSRPLPSPGEAARAASPPEAVRAVPGPGLVPVQSVPEGEDTRLRTPVARLPVELDVVVPIRAFRVHHLLALAPGQVIESCWRNGEDVPLAAGDVQLAWSEFEVIDTHLAVRVTRLA